MKGLLITLFFIFPLIAHSAQVTLLTSFKTPRIWYHKKDWEVTKTLAKRFRKSFEESGLDFKIIHKATAADLSRELNNPENRAVYWVSHSNQAVELGQGIKVPDLVYTINNIDVKNLFQKVHPNIKFLALIGCRGENLLNNYRKQGAYDNNPALKTFAFKKKVDPRVGLRKALKASISLLGKKGRHRMFTPTIIASEQVKKPIPSRCIEQEMVTLRLTRSTDKESLASAELTLDGRLLAFIPQSQQQQQELTVQLPVKFFNQSTRRKLTLSYLDSEGGDLGTLNFAAASMQWKLFAKRDGTPIGQSKNLYLYKGKRNEQISGEIDCLSFE